MAASRIKRPRHSDFEKQIIGELMLTAWIRLKPVAEQYSVKSNQKREVGIMADSYVEGVRGLLDYLTEHGIISRPEQK